MFQIMKHVKLIFKRFTPKRKKGRKNKRGPMSKQMTMPKRTNGGHQKKARGAKEQTNLS